MASALQMEMTVLRCMYYRKGANRWANQPRNFCQPVRNSSHDSGVSRKLFCVSRANISSSSLVVVLSIITAFSSKSHFRLRASKKTAQRRADIEKFTKLYAEQTGEKDSALIAQGGRDLYKKHVWQVHSKNMKDPWNAHTGKPIAKEGFMKWTDDHLRTVF